MFKSFFFYLFFLTFCSESKKFLLSKNISPFSVPMKSVGSLEGSIFEVLLSWCNICGSNINLKFLITATFSDGVYPVGGPTVTLFLFLRLVFVLNFEPVCPSLFLGRGFLVTDFRRSHQICTKIMLFSCLNPLPLLIQLIQHVERSRYFHYKSSWYHKTHEQYFLYQKSFVDFFFFSLLLLFASLMLLMSESRTIKHLDLQNSDFSYLLSNFAHSLNI